MLCTGVADLRPSPGTAFRLGGLNLIDLRDGRPLHQVPVPLWTPGGLDMTHNPTWFEATSAGLRGYFMPEDNTSTVFTCNPEERIRSEGPVLIEIRAPTRPRSSSPLSADRRGLRAAPGK